jgi:hypothetical protein
MPWGAARRTNRLACEAAAQWLCEVESEGSDNLPFSSWTRCGVARLKFFHQEVRSRLDWTASADEAVVFGAEGGRFAPGCPTDVVGILGAGVNYAGPPSCCVVAVARPKSMSRRRW